MARRVIFHSGGSQLSALLKEEQHCGGAFWQEKRPPKVIDGDRLILKSLVVICFKNWLKGKDLARKNCDTVFFF